MVDRLLISLLTGGHVLLEGVPGLAKTLTVRTLAETIDTTFHRIQFTPDLLPADVLGTQVYDQSTGQFSVKRGPIFANIILADEINRAPAKVQAALLEAMQEKQVTIGGTTFKLEEPFLVLATQNPIEQEGHVSAARSAGRPLHAQAARRLSDARRREGDHAAHGGRRSDRRAGGGLAARRSWKRGTGSPSCTWTTGSWITSSTSCTLRASRRRRGLPDLAPLIEFGASPRATIALAQASRAHAFLRGRAFVTPDDVKAIAPDVLRHRVLTTYEAEAEEVTSDQIVQRVLAKIEIARDRGVWSARFGQRRLTHGVGNSFADARRPRGADRSCDTPRPRRAARQPARATPSAAVPPEVLRQVKLLELRTRGLVNSLFTGEYRSVFKGQGMEFSEVREYQPGDEVRSIDWNVTARMQRPYVKRYIEERELTVMLAVDVSGSERFGTRRRFKSEVASELAAVLAMSAIRNNDRVGGLMFTDRIEHVVPPRKGRRHALRLIRDFLAFEPVGAATDIGGATEYLNKMLGAQGDHLSRLRFSRRERRASAQAARAAPRRRRRHGRGSERARAAGHRARAARRSGNRRRRSTSIRAIRRCARSSSSRCPKMPTRRRHLFRRLAIDEITVNTDTGIMDPLLRFFRARERRIRK